MLTFKQLRNLSSFHSRKEKKVIGRRSLENFVTLTLIGFVPAFLQNVYAQRGKHTALVKKTFLLKVLLSKKIQLS